jgi:hypothetical protein
MATDVKVLIRANDGLNGDGVTGQCAGCRGYAVVTLTGLTEEMTAALGAGFANPQKPVKGACATCGRPFPAVKLHVDSHTFENEDTITEWWLAKS